MTCNFTFGHYKELLIAAKHIGYDFLQVSDLFQPDSRRIPTPPFIILGHDVDHVLDAHNIKPLMDIENEVGVRSSWFFRVHANYNPLFHDNFEMIQQLVKNGHEVGLHLDTDFYGLFSASPELKNIARDLTILHAIVGQSIKIANAHNKSGSANGGEVTEAILRTLGVSYCDYTVLRKLNIKYLSDSSHAFREGCLCQWIEKTEPRIYCTIHPSWRHWRSSCENY